jgi:hypothetical protein
MQRDQVTALIMRVAAWSEIVAGRLAARRLKASSLLTDEPLRVREEGELRAVDPHLRALHNVQCTGGHVTVTLRGDTRGAMARGGRSIAGLRTRLFVIGRFQAVFRVLMPTRFLYRCR